MTQYRKTVTVIITLFCVFFGTALLSLLANPDTFGQIPFPVHPFLLRLTLLALVLAALAMLLFKENARRAFVGLNVALCFYLIVLMVTFSEVRVFVFVLMTVVASLFFSLDRVRGEFAMKKSFVRKSVLVVDDDEGSLKAVKGILLPCGYSVLTANSGEKGLQIASMQRPDLIILDVILPGIKGREACATLKQDEKTKDIPVIFLTAKDSLDDIHAEMAAGAVSHLTKPVHAKTLLAEVRRILDQYSKKS